MDVLGEVRAETLPTRPPDFATWARRWEAVLDEEDGLLDLVAAGRLEEAKDRVRAHLAGNVAAPLR